MGACVSRILCPIDFSATSTGAFHHALAIARWFGADVAVVHVHALRVPVAALNPYGRHSGVEPEAPSNTERDLLAETLRTFVETEALFSPHVSWHLDESTDVAQSIVARARALRADLIVMGTHGRTALKRLVLGSITERVLRTAPCAVMAVPPGTSKLQPPASLQRVICALDFSPCSTRTLECAATLAARAHAALTVAHIVELPPEVPGSIETDLSGYRRARFDEARRLLDHALTTVTGNGLQVDPLLLAGRAGQELLRLIAEQQADLIVMGMQGHSLAERLLFGSVTTHVLRQAPCPLLAVPPRSYG